MRIVNPIGKLGEDLAADYLIQKGYKILERNFRKGYGELDIIAIGRGNILVCVEVKTRTSIQFGTPFESITPWKLKEIIKTFQFYKLMHPKLSDNLRIDAISVQLNKNQELENIEHLENISGF